MEQLKEIERASQLQRRFTAAQFAAQAASIRRRTGRSTFTDGKHSATHTVLNHPLCPQEERTARPVVLPKRIILPGLRTI